jgi:TRAP-type mannitol/chloroaromatic compound transport system permease large subunit
MVLAFIVLLVLLALGMPIGFAMVAASLAYMLLAGGIPLSLTTQSMALSMDSFTILAVPLFILRGIS